MEAFKNKLRPDDMYTSEDKDLEDMPDEWVKDDWNID